MCIRDRAGITSYAYENTNNNELNCKTVVGIPVLKQGEYLIPDIKNWIENEKSNFGKLANWKLLTNYHHGGYAKQSDALTAFQNEFKTLFQTPIDPIYTSKAFYAFFDQLKSDQLPQGSNIILYHSGGLQGITTNK